MTYKSIPTVSCMTTVFDGFVHSTFVLLTYCIPQHFLFLLNFNDRYMVGQMVPNVRITFSKAKCFWLSKVVQLFFLPQFFGPKFNGTKKIGPKHNFDPNIYVQFFRIKIYMTNIFVFIKKNWTTIFLDQIVLVKIFLKKRFFLSKI